MSVVHVGMLFVGTAAAVGSPRRLPVRFFVGLTRLFDCLTLRRICVSWLAGCILNSSGCVVSVIMPVCVCIGSVRFISIRVHAFWGSFGFCFCFSLGLFCFFLCFS